MKLHDPATERELLRLAAAGRQGKPMESSDGKDLISRFFKPLVAIFYAYIPAGFLGINDARLRTEHWQTLICCLLLMWTIQFAIAGLGVPLTRNGAHAVLPNLPIDGEHAFRWARYRYFVEKWFSHLCVSFFCAFTFHDFSLDAPWSLAATTLMLVAMIMSSVQVLQQPWVARLRFLRIWTILSALLICWLIFMQFTSKRIFRIGETPEWMVDAILGFTWLLPPSWVLPGRFESGGVILAVGWMVYGILLWRRWPAVEAPFLDRPRDFAGSFGDFAEDEEPEDADSLTGETRLEPASGNSDAPVLKNKSKKGEIRELPLPLAISRDGWVERWVLWWISEKDQTIAGVFCDTGPSWTLRAKWILRILPAWLLLSWLCLHFLPRSEWKDIITVWIWIISIILPFIGLMPFSNAVTTASFPWSAGGHSFPFFAALPVSTRSLLRISMRVTFARCVLMALIGMPYACVVMLILLPQIPAGVSALMALWLVPAFCCFWATARPVFVWYRLQAVSRRKSGVGMLVVHPILAMLSVVLGVICLVSGFFGILSGFGYIRTNPEGYESWFLPLGAVGGLVASALCARAVFEIHLWRLGRRQLDWITSQ